MFWLASNSAYILVIALLAFHQLNSIFFRVVPNFIKFIWLIVIGYTMLLLFDTAMSPSLFGFSDFLLKLLNIDNPMYLRTNATALWIGLYVLIISYYEEAALLYISRIYAMSRFDYKVEVIKSSIPTHFESFHFSDQNAFFAAESAAKLIFGKDCEQTDFAVKRVIWLHIFFTNKFYVEHKVEKDKNCLFRITKF